MEAAQAELMDLSVPLNRQEGPRTRQRLGKWDGMWSGAGGP